MTNGEYNLSREWLRKTDNEKQPKSKNDFTYCLDNCIRISVGRPEQPLRLLAELHRLT